ncbi:hypothetical protein [Candidatus Nitrotoga sp. M5]|uniref:hypothetical protein n=1 Tax=Candidatus Nitrotoga sp. M5 TaxID=2890409 RepID=UPI001EF5E0CE|nr:hypothetical protein [Candidatus Nitrotoga sp. M5]CAH1387059.1 Pyrophosphatase [Candidatus Nitrotoga sp. M5]
MTTKTFADRIHNMNRMYALPCHTLPTLPENSVERLSKFKKTLLDEIHEVNEIIINIEDGVQNIDALTLIADWLGDITVYARSEAMKYGIPLEHVINIIMDSNESKLGEDGRPIYDENGKFLKGPRYWKPEGKIKQLLLGDGED